MSDTEIVRANVALKEIVQRLTEKYRFEKVMFMYRDRKGMKG